ncbi:RteC domain-containing protein [Dysgonomonas reticulitermitis]
MTNVPGKNAEIYLCKSIELVDKQIEWTEKQILAEHDSACPFRKQALPQALLRWTANKTDLIELLYALHTAGYFNNGKTSLNRIAQYFGEVFGIDLSCFPRDFYEM